MDPHIKGCQCGGNAAQRQSLGGATAGPASTPHVDIPRMRLSAQQQSLETSGSGTVNPCANFEPEDEGEPVMSDRQRERLEKEAKEAELAKWVSPLRQFDHFANGELRRRDIAEEDYPRLKVPQLKGHHRCRVSCLLNHSVDYAVEMEQELRNIGIQETQMMDMLEKLTRAEAAVRFQGAVRAAEVAAMSAPPELAEEAAVAGARGYTVESQEFSKSSKPGENPIEIVGYIGCTRPNNF